MRIITAEIESYFASIYAQIGDAVDIPFERVPGEWQPSIASCHANADYWAALHPTLKSVRGWFVEGPNDPFGYRFIAHSVLDDRGRWFDITPIDPSCIRPKFLAHEGTKETFDAMQPAFSSADYPFILVIEDSSAEIDEEWQ